MKTIRNIDRFDRFPIIFAFGHQSRMGKDYCAQFIRDKLGHKYSIKTFKFADVLKTVAHTLCLTEYPAVYYEVPPGVDRRREIPPGYNKSPVEVWTTLGPHLRAYDPDIFVRPIQHAIRRSKAELVLITDLRYPNEVAGLEAMQNVWVALIKVTSPDIVPLDSEADHALDDFDDWDYILSAHKGDLQALDLKICSIIKDLDL